MGESCRQSEGAAGEHPSTYTAETLALPSVNDQSWNARLYHDSQEMEACLQPVRIKTPAPSPAPFAGGEGGRGAYLDTDRNISRQVFEGRSIDGYERERKKKRFKHIANIAHALYHADEEQAGLRLLGCGYWFQRFNFGCGTYKLVPYPCDSIFCPQCAARRSKPLQDRILARMDQKNCDYFFLTVTVKSLEDLSREKIDRLVEMFGELRESNEWKQSGILGGVYSIEATYTDAGWHPHLHILIETKRGAFALHHIERFKKRWLAITGDSHVLHLKKMYGISEKGRKTRKIDVGALRELVKYATKSASFSHRGDKVLEFFNAFKSVRRMQAFGSFLGTVKEKEEEDEEKNCELVGCACGTCRWRDAKPAGRVHISQTILMFDGTRQLRLFDSGSDPPVEVISLERHQQDDCGTALGAIQKTSSLFDVATLAF